MPLRHARPMLALFAAGHRFVLDVARVREVLRAGATEIAVPHAHPAVRGLLPWRQRSVPLLELATFLGGTAVPAGQGYHIVVEVAGQHLALAVGGVGEVLRILPQQLLDDAHLPVASLCNVVLGCCQVREGSYFLLDMRPMAALVTARSPAPLPQGAP